MLSGAIIGGVIGLIYWVILAQRIRKISTAEALGPYPEVRESVLVPLSPAQVFERLRPSVGVYIFDPASTPEAILMRRNPDMIAAGYAFLLRVSPDGTGSKIDVSCAPLYKGQMKVWPKHYDAFRTAVLGVLR